MNLFTLEIWNLDPKLILWLIAIVIAAILSYFSAQFFYVLLWAPDLDERSADKRKEKKHDTFLLSSFFFLCGLMVFHTFVEVGMFTTLYGAARKQRREDVKVWVNKRSGFYYCPDSKVYGQLQPGSYMDERTALQGGYRPFFKNFCQ